MPPELLQKMRDIHYPSDPSWFPPAPGWWFVAALCCAGALLLYRRYTQHRRLAAPYGVAKQLLLRARTELERGELDARMYLDRCNDILKRLLVRVRNDTSATAASGDAWLILLDQLHGSQEFTTGPGTALGDNRFRREFDQDLSQLHDLLDRFIAKLGV